SGDRRPRGAVCAGARLASHSPGAHCRDAGARAGHGARSADRLRGRVAVSPTHTIARERGHPGCSTSPRCPAIRRAFDGTHTGARLMTHRSDGFPARTLVTALALFWIGAAAAAAWSERTPAAAAPTAAAAQAGNFVGDDTCVTCHESEGKSLKATLHGKAHNERTPAARSGQSCETCHGPGQKHVDSGKKEDIRRLTAMSARDASSTCLSCHGKGPHADWQGSMHDARNVSCVSCHSVHSPKSDKFQLRTASVVQTCEACHKQEAMKLQRNGHTP